MRRGVLAMSIEAARRRGEPPRSRSVSLRRPRPDLAGAYHRAQARLNLRETSGPTIERAGDLAAIVNDLDEGEVLFIDEIHRLARVVEEILYPAMEDFELNIVVGKGPGARTMKLAVKPFTMVDATTAQDSVADRARGGRAGTVHAHLSAISTAARLATSGFDFSEINAFSCPVRPG